MDTCIHIQTHSPHFKYTDLLIKSFLELTDINRLNIPIYIVVDNDIMIKEYNNKYKYNYENIYFLNIEKIINNININIKEKRTELFKEVINIKWGAGGHRNYVAVKRVYSILELKNRGFKYVWCLDSESLILNKVNILNIININKEKPLLTVGINNNGVKYNNIISNLFKFDNWDNYKNISVRMNDFWFIHTNYFEEMINYLFEIHNKPISYFINGSEQSVYEYYIYSKYLENNKSINLITIESDLHNNTLFNNIIRNRNIDINNISDILNKKYFNYIQSYRGDYYKNTLLSNRGKELINKLNINIAVSNYTGM